MKHLYLFLLIFFLFQIFVSAQQSDSVKTTLSEISRLMKILLEAYQLTKSSPIEALPLMIAVVEFAQEKHE